MSKKPITESRNCFVNFDAESWENFKALRASYPSRVKKSQVVRDAIANQAKLLQARQLAGVE